MYDSGHIAGGDILQRAFGELLLSVKRRGAATVLGELRQAGCLKARLPRVVTTGWIDVVMLNLSGGVVGGDRLTSAFTLGAGTRATISGQAAERFYRVTAGSAPSEVRHRIILSEASIAEWLPQETILFDGCAIDRALDVELADSAQFVGVEMLVFGRKATGEQVRSAWIRDTIRIRRAGRLILRDAVRLDGNVDALLWRRAIGHGARAAATVVYAAPEAERAAEAVRLSVADAPAETGVSCWDGILVARMLAADSADLRQTVITALTVLRAGRPMPRVWLC